MLSMVVVEQAMVHYMRVANQLMDSSWVDTDYGSITVQLEQDTGQSTLFFF